MKEYHKINAPFKRNNDGDKKLVIGDWALPEFEYLANNTWEFTEKVDGTNIRVELVRGDGFLDFSYGGRTDNANIPPALLKSLRAQFDEDDEFTALALEMMSERGINSLTLYGEGYGPKINGGGKYRETPGFVLFDVWVDGWWLLRDNVNDIGKRLDVDTVPVVGYGSLYRAIDAVRAPGFKSVWGEFTPEGIVARPLIPLFDRKGQRIITKIKVRDFV